MTTPFAATYPSNIMMTPFAATRPSTKFTHYPTNQLIRSSSTPILPRRTSILHVPTMDIISESPSHATSCPNLRSN